MVPGVVWGQLPLAEGLGKTQPTDAWHHCGYPGRAGLVEKLSEIQKARFFLMPYALLSYLHPSTLERVYAYIIPPKIFLYLYNYLSIYLLSCHGNTKAEKSVDDSPRRQVPGTIRLRIPLKMEIFNDSKSTHCWYLLQFLISSFL